MREPVRERAVVREQERAGRVDVEPPDRNDPRLVLDELDDGRPAVRVARGRDHARGLVQEHVGELLPATGSPSTSTSSPGSTNVFSSPRLAVDLHPARLDQLVGLAARGDAGAGEEGVQPHREAR